MPTDLHDLGPGLEIPIPGSSPAVRLWRLHAEEKTGASVSLVRFPSGWSRPGVGHYLAAEEFVLFEGDLEVGERYTPGDYVFLPPRATRSDSASRDGALALAWFSGPPTWIPGSAEPPVPVEPTVVHGALAADTLGVRRLREAGELPGGLELRVGPAAEVPVVGGRGGADVLCPETSRWEWVPEGESGTLTSRLLVVRAWA